MKTLKQSKAKCNVLWCCRLTSYKWNLYMRIIFSISEMWHCLCIESSGSGSDEDEDDSPGPSRKKGSFSKLTLYS